ncbi:long-chain-fatty-acid-CoA ligase [Schizosaccharomyces japonicus yFS275]|uniref:Long-chain-fatty-acid-CoA ligase n=1 Tax=Schizosaccharomyces japonicus (strain yFS275 / FY16936) TaxID=402676 RepID=B6K5D6_SCHJY|nr:long-chain-fatty-acid-CoA ligase [Schizosaccharomyces japonicus yFS275]EEB08740.1 long-chain-fatty-acid-CoA ligase [Schizosaccharomyces japonicus yFS275]
MKELFSVETTEPRKPGETHVYRSVHSAKGLLERPEEGINTVYDVLKRAITAHGNKDAMGWRKRIKTHVEEREVVKKIGDREVKEKKHWILYELGPYQYISFTRVYELACAAGAGLRQLNFQAGDRLLLFATTSSSWFLTAQGCVTQSVPIVTAYETLGEPGLITSVSESKPRAIFTDPGLLSKLIVPLKDAPFVETILCSSQPTEEQTAALKAVAPQLKFITFDELIATGEKNPCEVVPPAPSDVCVYMYTSGSTGKPKGVMLLHRNIVSVIAGINRILSHHINEKDYVMAYLPLAHVFEFFFEMCCLYWGGVLGYGSVRTLNDASVKNCRGDLAEFRPSVLIGVPAVFEALRKGIMAKVSQMPIHRQKIFSGALSLKQYLMGKNLPGTELLDALVFNKIKAATGGRIRYCINGGAALAPTTQAFISAAIAPVLLGYGLTETCAGSFVLSPEAFYLFSRSVGAPIPCVEFKLVDIPELNYLTSQNPPRGEVWIRGPSVCGGYFNRTDATQEVFTEDGWFKTGDVGELDENNMLCLIDRKKNIVKSLNGEYIALEKLETQFNTSKLILNICVYADTQHYKPVCIVVPAEGPLREQLKSVQGKEFFGNPDESLSALCKDPQVRSVVLADLISIAKQRKFATIETPQSVVLVDDEWTPDNDLLTPSRKLKRQNIVARYNDLIMEAYGN